MAQGIFRPLQVPETGRGLEYPHSEKQHQKAVAHGLQPLIDADNGVPYIAAPELLGRGGNQGPYLGQLVIPNLKGGLQSLYHPVIAQMNHLAKKKRIFRLNFGWNMCFKQFLYASGLKPKYLIDIIFSRVFQMVDIYGLTLYFVNKHILVDKQGAKSVFAHQCFTFQNS